jgi:pyruvate,water dikinase
VGRARVRPPRDGHARALVLWQRALLHRSQRGARRQQRDALRFINGYLYISPNEHPDPDGIGERAETFSRRAGHYYANWDEIYANWVAKAEDCIGRLAAIEFRPLPGIEPEESVTGHTGLYSTYELSRRYDELIQNLFEMGSYHFEMLNLGYGAYLTFREFCQEASPGITDQTVARMVAGIDIMLFRPDDEVRKLTRLALESGLADVLRDNHDPDALLAAMAARDAGPEWLAALEAAKDPWFWYSTGAGYTHTDRAWRDDLRLPLNAMRGYLDKLEQGEEIERPLEKIMEERGRITAEYRELLATDEDRAAFDELVELARTVYPYVENHNFYVEHWHHIAAGDLQRAGVVDLERVSDLRDRGTASCRRRGRSCTRRSRPRVGARLHHRR